MLLILIFFNFIFRISFFTLTAILFKFLCLMIFNKRISEFLDFPNVTTFIFFLLALLFKKLKNLLSLFNTIVPLIWILSIISLFAFAMPLIFLKFSICASAIFVIIAMFGLRFLIICEFHLFCSFRPQILQIYDLY